MLYTNGKIKTVDIQCDLQVFRMEIWARRVMKSCRFARCERKPPSRGNVTGPALHSIAQMERAQLIFVGSHNRVITHRDQCDAARRVRLQRPGCGSCRHK